MIGSSFVKALSKASWALKIKVTAVVAVGLTGLYLSVFFVYKIIDLKIHFKKTREIAVKDEAVTVNNNIPSSFIYELKQISIPVTGRKSMRVGTAQFSLTLNLSNAESYRWMELNRARLLSITYDVASELSFEELNSTDGLKIFKDALREGFKDAFGNRAPSEVFIQDWVIQ